MRLVGQQAVVFVGSVGTVNVTTYSTSACGVLGQNMMMISGIVHLDPITLAVLGVIRSSLAVLNLLVEFRTQWSLLEVCGW